MDLPPVLTPPESPTPDKVCEETEVNDRVRAAIAALPGRERRIIGLYYYSDATMKEIGAEIGVNESRVSQLHARAIRKLREQLAPDLAPEQFKGDAGRRREPDASARASEDEDGKGGPAAGGCPALRGRAATVRQALTSRATCRRSARRNGFRSQRQPLSSRNASASAVTTSPVTNTIRRVSDGTVPAICPVECLSVQPRHLQVADHQVVRPSPCLFECGLTVRGAVDEESCVLQGIAHGFCERRLVLDQEHGGSSSDDRLLPRCGRRPGPRQPGAGREPHVERGAVPRGRLHLELAAVILDDPAGDCQAEPRPRPRPTSS